MKGLLDLRFAAVRENILATLGRLGYRTGWNVLNASSFGLPQLRPRLFFVALRPRFASEFSWPPPLPGRPAHVGETLLDLMAARGWEGAAGWAGGATGIAPTLVGGSKLHGGPDLGPTRARRAWAGLGVDGRSVANESPGPGHAGPPRLTTRMAARIQGFPDTWTFSGSKTSVYRQVANALPPNVAEAVGRRIAEALGAPSPADGEVAGGRVSRLP